jgi:hypothetical protein
MGYDYFTCGICHKDIYYEYTNDEGETCYMCGITVCSDCCCGCYTKDENVKI